MKLTDYIKDKFITIFIHTVSIAFICLTLSVFNLNYSVIVLIGCVLFLTNFIALIMEHARRQSFYKMINKSLETLDKRYLVSELIDKPGFIEGELLYDTLKASCKSMNDNIAIYKNSSEEYREYIETWVHEVKTPIAASKLIIENNKNEITQSLENELTKIDSYVEQALFYSKSNNVQKDYIIREISLEDVVKGVIKKHSRALIESKTSIVIKDLSFKVFADIKWIDFILGQIITNSIKYKTQSPKLNIYAVPLKNSIALIIEDNGVGICECDIKRVFDKGFTGLNGRNFAKSTGIGLYLCKKLCVKMGLSITISSEVGTGTKVKIIFPKSKMEILESES